MKTILGLSLLLLSACGSAPSQGAPSGGAASSTPSVSAGTHSYVLIASGDNQSFAGAIFSNPGDADEVQFNPGPASIPAGTSVTYSANARTALVQITALNTNGTNVHVELYRDGVLVQAMNLAPSDSANFGGVI
jgi:hypothetical protein